MSGLKQESSVEETVVVGSIMEVEFERIQEQGQESGLETLLRAANYIIANGDHDHHYATKTVNENDVYGITINDVFHQNADTDVVVEVVDLSGTSATNGTAVSIDWTKHEYENLSEFILPSTGSYISQPLMEIATASADVSSTTTTEVLSPPDPVNHFIDGGKKKEPGLHGKRKFPNSGSGSNGQSPLSRDIGIGTVMNNCTSSTSIEEVTHTCSGKLGKEISRHLNSKRPSVIHFAPQSPARPVPISKQQQTEHNPTASTSQVNGNAQAAHQCPQQQQTPENNPTPSTSQINGKAPETRQQIPENIPRLSQETGFALTTPQNQPGRMGEEYQLRLLPSAPCYCHNCLIQNRCYISNKNQPPAYFGVANNNNRNNMNASSGLNSVHVNLNRRPTQSSSISGASPASSTVDHHFAHALGSRTWDRLSQPPTQASSSFLSAAVSSSSALSAVANQLPPAAPEYIDIDSD